MGGLPEDINNKIKVIKSMAYGFLDDDYFILKIWTTDQPQLLIPSKK